MSTFSPILNAANGGSGPATTGFMGAREAFIEGAQELGMPRCDDYNSGDNQMGVGYFQRLIHHGFRRSAARVFLHPARASGRLDVRTGARAARR